ncbi:MAG: hypothetical protein ABR999_02405 [Methanoregula sp.]
MAVVVGITVRLAVAFTVTFAVGITVGFAVGVVVVCDAGVVLVHPVLNTTRKITSDMAKINESRLVDI